MNLDVFFPGNDWNICIATHHLLETIGNPSVTPPIFEECYWCLVASRVKNLDLRREVQSTNGWNALATNVAELNLWRWVWSKYLGTFRQTFGECWDGWMTFGGGLTIVKQGERESWLVWSVDDVCWIEEMGEIEELSRWSGCQRCLFLHVCLRLSGKTILRMK